ncbi:hypothetical protein MCOR29_010848, partial [Pyricularia oryzae]
MHTLAAPLVPPENKTHNGIPIVRIRRPACSLTGPSLLDLPAVDGDCTSLDYELALTACSIITGNTEGYLARHEDDAQTPFSPVQYSDGMLRPGTYFYCLKGPEGKELENKYPVVLSLHPPSASPQIALHVLLPSESDQMLELSLNRQLQPLRDIAVEFLFSRFAWLILHPETYTFTQPTTTRYEIKIWDQDKGVSKIESISGFAFGDIYASRSRSRSISEDGIDDDSGRAWESWLGWDPEQREPGEERRGRSRARKRSRKMSNSLPLQDWDSGLLQSEMERIARLKSPQLKS